MKGNVKLKIPFLIEILSFTDYRLIILDLDHSLYVDLAVLNMINIFQDISGYKLN